MKYLISSHWANWPIETEILADSQEEAVEIWLEGQQAQFPEETRDSLLSDIHHIEKRS